MSRPQLADAPIIDANSELLGSLRGQFGEAATWSETHQGVWWVDMHGHAVNWSGIDGRSRLWKTPAPELPWARCLLPGRNGNLIVGLSDKLARFDPGTGSFSAIDLPLSLAPGHMFNDAAVDARGRIVIGTMFPGRGDDSRAEIYSIDGHGQVVTLIRGLNTSNGIAFSPACDRIYWSDSHASVQTVWCAPYNIATGGIGDRTVFAEFSDLPGRPDGGCIDDQGGYWSAAIGSPYIHRFAPDGTLTLSLLLPMNMPTRPCFGGPDLRELFVTTGGLKGGEYDDGVKGGLLRMQPGARGLPGPVAAI
jgi:L-arabinonolactonase